MWVEGVCVKRRTKCIELFRANDWLENEGRYAFDYYFVGSIAAPCRAPEGRLIVLFYQSDRAR